MTSSHTSDSRIGGNLLSSGSDCHTVAGQRDAMKLLSQGQLGIATWMATGEFNMKRKTIIIVSTVVALAACVSAIAAIPVKKEAAAASPVMKAAATPTEVRANVAVMPVHASQLTRTVRVNGITLAKKDVTYAAQTAGWLEYVGADIGDMIKRRMTLARVDYKTQRALEMQAQASYRLAEATHARMASLGADLVSAQKLDEARYAMQGARANLDLATANAANAVVKADTRGEVAEKFVEKGEFVAPGTPLFRVVDTRTIVVEAAIPESQIDAITAGSEVTVQIDALSRTYTGIVRTIIPRADPASRTFTVRVDVENGDGRILVGMSASLQIDTDTLADVIKVPQELVIEGTDGRYVYVVQNDRARKVPVTLGDTDGDEVVITRGIVLNDMLVTFGHRSLTDNQPVNIVDQPIDMVAPSVIN